MRVVDLYKGWFVDGTREGFGAHVSPSGLEYEGEWKDNKQDGKGKMKWPDGDMYEGECGGGANQDCFISIDACCGFAQRIVRRRDERRIRQIRQCCPPRI